MCYQPCHEPAAWPWAGYSQPWYGCSPVPLYYYLPSWCPGCGQPAGACGCAHGHKVAVPEELAAAPGATTATLVVGGAVEVKPILEYLPAGDPNGGDPEVTVETTTEAGVTTFDEKPVPAGFHVKSDFPAVKPGTKLKLTVNNCYARLRWCERVEY